MLPETRELYELEKLWTLRGYDEQLMKIPPERLPEDFIFDDLEVTKWQDKLPYFIFSDTCSVSKGQNDAMISLI